MVPSAHTAKLYSFPAINADTVLPASTPDRFTNTGTKLFTVLPLPSCPLELYPHPASTPSEHMTRQWPSPTDSEVMVLPASTPLMTTATGTMLEVGLVLLIPNRPWLLLPQAANMPSAHKARPLELPAAISITLLPASTPVPSIACGTLKLAWPPVMSRPHWASVPSEHSAMLVPLPTAILMIVLPASTPTLDTNTGTGLSVKLLLPNWPQPLSPHPASVPSEQSARL